LRRSNPSRPSGTGALTLADYPGDAVHVVCNKQDRRGLYSKDRLIARHGAGIGLPDLLHKIAADCPRVLKPLGNDLCGAHYPDLVANDI
jgi:hypothetical protein